MFASILARTSSGGEEEGEEGESEERESESERERERERSTQSLFRENRVNNKSV